MCINLLYLQEKVDRYSSCLKKATYTVLCEWLLVVTEPACGDLK